MQYLIFYDFRSFEQTPRRWCWQAGFDYQSGDTKESKNGKTEIAVWSSWTPTGRGKMIIVHSVAIDPQLMQRLLRMQSRGYRRKSARMGPVDLA